MVHGVMYGAVMYGAVMYGAVMPWCDALTGSDALAIFPFECMPCQRVI